MRKIQRLCRLAEAQRIRNGKEEQERAGVDTIGHIKKVSRIRSFRMNETGSTVDEQTLLENFMNLAHPAAPGRIVRRHREGGGQ
ncbi:hypothetical protein CBM2585_B50336 [Cupriavidus taiwanensis]|nr:hypothetical protein CBM2585_B50336 [Cupriavidus taiwanensis]